MKCNLCTYECKFNSELKKHQVQKHNVGVIWKICDLCNNKFKTTSHLNTHMKTVHLIGVIWHQCNICDFRCNNNSNLTAHKINIHSDIKPYKCDKCTYQCKQKDTLKEHNTNVHNVDIIWFKCTACDYKCKNNRTLRKHSKCVHHINVEWVYCDQNNCNYKCTSTELLNAHKSSIHNLNVHWYNCDTCSYKSKKSGHVLRHKANLHNVNTKLHLCNLCDYAAKSKENLKKHKSQVHDIDVAWFNCGSCEWKFKTNVQLKRHLTLVHDIGDKVCQFCARNVYTLTPYKDKSGDHKICRKCYNKATGKNSRAEKDMSDRLDKELGMEFLIGTDRRIMGEACQLYRPDKIYADPIQVNHYECDEHQHEWSSGNYACDERRISEIYDEFPGKDYKVIRWNPDNFKVPEGKVKPKNRKERLDLLAKIAHAVKTIHFDTKINIIYIYYSKDNPRIAKNIPVHFIYDEEDLNKLIKTTKENVNNTGKIKTPKKKIKFI